VRASPILPTGPHDGAGTDSTKDRNFFSPTVPDSYGQLHSPQNESTPTRKCNHGNPEPLAKKPKGKKGHKVSWRCFKNLIEGNLDPSRVDMGGSSLETQETEK
jgi:hypothetical protein